jgi:hypothetical protein
MAFGSKVDTPLNELVRLWLEAANDVRTHRAEALAENNNNFTGPRGPWRGMVMPTGTWASDGGVGDMLRNVYEIGLQTGLWVGMDSVPSQPAAAKAMMDQSDVEDFIVATAPPPRTSKGRGAKASTARPSLASALVQVLADFCDTEDVSAVTWNGVHAALRSMLQINPLIRLQRLSHLYVNDNTKAFATALGRDVGEIFAAQAGGRMGDVPIHTIQLDEQDVSGTARMTLKDMREITERLLSETTERRPRPSISISGTADARPTDLMVGVV